ncbi:MAG TPA: hypothetical protein P5531_03405 [Bacteroidales bacterium]|nr:hypothetical protein [Bacteroidales bacterium]HSA42433.1 hypothetical protein [Bacteroidales bacterium]
MLRSLISKGTCLLAVYLLFVSPGSVRAQHCVEAEWIKTLGGNAIHCMITDAARTPDGNFVVLGSYGNAPLVLDTITLPSLSNPYYLAVLDAAGNVLKAKVVMSGNTNPYKISVGPDGSVYITGYFTGGFMGPDTLPTASRQRFFAAKYNADLDLVWKRLSDWMSADCKGFDITVDLNGNAYVVGAYEDNAFKLGDFVCQNRGGWNSWSDDAFLLKLNPAGGTEWLVGIGSEQDEAARTVTADSVGNVFVTGITTFSNSALYFDEQFAIPAGSGNMTLFYARYSGLDGHCIWGRISGEFFSGTRLYPFDAALGAGDRLYLCGEIAGRAYLEPQTAYSADNGGFLACISSLGQCEWIEVMGGQGTSEYANHVAYHGGRVAVCGELFSNQPYVGGFPLYSLQTGGSFDAFNAQFTADGSLLWARGNNSPSMTGYLPQGIAIDNSGAQLIFGSFLGSQSWYPLTVNNTSSYLKSFIVRFITPAPTTSFTVSAGPDKSGLCGANLQLSGSTNPSNIAFGWFPDLGFSLNGTKTPTLQPSMPGSYILYGSYQGCTMSDTMTVSLTNHSLTLMAPQSVEFCQGDSVLLVVSCNEPSASFSWLPDVYLSNDTLASPWAKPPVSTNYIVAATHNACKVTDTVTVFSRPKPFIALPKQDNYYGIWRYHLCQGDHYDFNMGDPLNNYVITTPDIVSNVFNNLATLLGDSTGTHWLKVQAVSPYGCSNKDSVLLVVHNNQTAPVILGTIPNRSACPGDSLRINLWITNSIQYNFQYSWYAGWQIDSMNGQGWKDISIWDKNYEIFNYSSGYPTSTYYSQMRIPLITAGMNGFRLRCYIHDYCSPRVYSNVSTISVGPKITQQPLGKTLCQGVTDSISINSSSPATQYQWEVWQNGAYVPVLAQAGVIVPNGRFLRFVNVQPSLDSTWYRCRTDGCSPAAFAYSDSALIRVVSMPSVLWQSTDDTVCEGAVDSFMVVNNVGPYTYNWYQNNTALTYNTSQMCCFNTNKMVFTPVYLTQNNYTYKLRIRNNQCNFETYSTPVRFYVLPAAPVTWPGGNLNICDNVPPFVLAGATPPGGTYSGPGVSGGIFDPSAAGLGFHYIYYSVDSSVSGCGGSTYRVFQVKQAPVVSWDDDTIHLCQGDPPFPLTGGLPAGGTYSGTGVMNSSFYTSSSGIGSFTVKYKKTDISTGCADSALRVVSVHAKPAVSWPGGTVMLCEYWSPVMLNGGQPAGGQYTGNAVSAGVFTPAMAGNGLHTLVYTYTDPLTNCTDTAQRQFFVDPCTGIDQGEPSEIGIHCLDGFLVLQADKAGTSAIRIELLDAYGRLVFDTRVDNPCQPCRIALPHLNPAPYLVRLSGTGIRIVRKIIIP